MKIDRSKIRELLLKGYNDREIAEELNCKAQTIFIIRTRELKIYKDSLFFLKEWRKAYFNPANRQIAIYLTKILLNKLNLNPEENICYRTTYELPNRIILDLKPEKDIIDKSNIRRGLKSKTNVKNAEAHVKISEDLCE